MEIVKKHLFLVVTGILLIVTGIIGSILIVSKNNQIKKFEQEVEKIITAEQGFITSKYALMNDNVIRAEENYNKTQEKFNGLIKELQEKFPPPEIETEMTPLKFKLNLRQFCIKMENLLRGEDVYIPDNLKYFSYDRYMEPDVLPNNEEINLILKQLEIIGELVYLISQSQVNKLLTFRRLNDYKTIDREFYNFMPFELELVGDIESIQRIMNSLNEAKFFFMPRTFDLMAREVKRKGRPEIRDEPLSKRKRLAFSKEPAEVKVKLIVDYFEFHNR